MNKQSRSALDAYFAEADSWAHDRQDALIRSRRIAWIVAAIAALVALFEATALLLLMPLKTVVPYTLMVDRQTGYVQALKPLDPQLVSSDAALTQSFLVQYVIAREGYDSNSLQADYRKVALWSAGDARSDYVTGMQASSPGSPLALYPRSTVIDVRVKSVTAIGKNVAMVRYDTRRRDAGGQVGLPRAWVAVIRYGYSDAAMTAEDRYINPLGFQVLRYRRSVETLPPADPAPASPAGSAPSPGQGVTVPAAGSYPDPNSPRPPAAAVAPRYPRPSPAPGGVSVTL
jgi:type IV secretion system protein VirB8